MNFFVTTLFFVLGLVGYVPAFAGGGVPLNGMTKIATGGDHSCAVNGAGAVLCWGSNVVGQLGNAIKEESRTPVAVSGLGSNVSAIAAGDAHSCALTGEGAVYCWGENDGGKLGNGTTEDSSTPLPVSGLGSGIRAITAGTSHTCALTNGGAVLCWGWNWDGQLGNNTRVNSHTPVTVSGLSSGVLAISAGGGHTCALVSGGSVQCWGWNVYGQLGNSRNEDSPVPVSVDALGGAVIALTTGYSHSCALLSTGFVQCWGDDSYGQLNGNSEARSSPVLVDGLGGSVAAIASREFHTCALTNLGAVKCWGSNVFGQLGNGTLPRRRIVVEVSGLPDVSAIAAGGAHSCALTKQGAIRCWGNDTSGQLGDGSVTRSLIPVAVAGLAGSSAIDGGANHVCAVLGGGAVHCWGDGIAGQLGNNSLADSPTPVAVSGLEAGVSMIAAGGYHNCALINGSAEVRCWGSNGHGQLGNNSFLEGLTPVVVSGLGSGIVALAAGQSHSCAVRNGSVLCWGDNFNGQLGNSSTSDSPTPVAVSGLGVGAMTVAAGAAHSCALTDGGAVWCWGNNTYGQLGNNSYSDSLTPVAVTGLSSGIIAISAGEHHSCAVTSEGVVLCWGNNSVGQLGDGGTTNGLVPVVSRLPLAVKAIDIAADHSCAITNGGAVYCWGQNYLGQLGNNSTVDSLIPVAVSGLNAGIVMVSTGYSYTCALKVNGVVLCWGSNWSGQLGSNSASHSPVPVSVLTAASVTQLEVDAAPSGYVNGMALVGGVSGTTTPPMGAITFLDGAQVLCESVPLVSSRASCLAKTLAAGSHTFVANYAGDINNAPSQATLTVNVVSQPGQPSINAIAPGHGSALFSLIAPSSSGDSPVVSYTVTCTASGQPTRSATGTGPSLTVRNLKGGVSYSCTAKASNASQTGAASAAQTVTPLPGSGVMTPVLLLLLD